ncbi:peptide/nickel transport system ATP-binding protein [Actinocorallia herbida]|uniref:Peptide/nickel transport system ATP-binding protein n=1 Tax=Actinocorallia herbida TaxID=58109 RepID=A0A3N1D690_9ACTN|nr:ABC transporter ATP-binding protein [Actinocorallia herbida]ROO88979.1 peptide/nickel transport system ATP-binding protein [Actinocorallia herbida]
MTAMAETAMTREARPLVEVDGLRVHRAADGRTLLSDVSFAVEAGRSLAIVGESGSGKSLTVRALFGLLPSGLKASGNVDLAGVRVSEKPKELRRLRGTTVSLLLQDPFTLLNPLRPVGKQISDGLPRGKRTAAEVARRLAEVGLPADVAERRPYELSGGMRQRVGLACALADDPQVLVADEPTTALDVTTQAEVLDLIRRVQRERGMAFVLITHDLRVAFSMCDDVLVLYAGRTVETGPADAVREGSRHPYTRALLAAEPPLDRRLAVLPSVPGNVPAHDAVTGRCGFADRCALASDTCRAGTPELRPAGPGRRSACVRADEVALTFTPEPALAAEPAPSDPAAPALLEIRGITRTFRGAKRPALGGIDLRVAPGEAVGIVGESGSGKTTLARCVVGLERPDGGTITFDGTSYTDLRALPKGDRARVLRGVQMVFQDPYSSLNPVRSVGAVLAEALRAAGREGGKTEVAALLDLVGLAPAVAARPPSGMSGGERQRVAIARAVAGRPKLLICDESVSALDVSVQAQILDLLAELRTSLSMALLFITHDLAVVRQITDRVYVLAEGTRREEGPTSRVLDAPADPYTRRLLASVPDPARRPA